MDEIMDKELILPEDKDLRNEELYSDLPPLTRGTSLTQYIADLGQIGGVLESNDEDVLDPLLIW